jgi:hypothetical protein
VTSPVVVAPAPPRRADPELIPASATTATRTPTYKKAWVWVVVGTVAAAGIGVGLGVGLGSKTIDPIPTMGSLVKQ